MSAEHPPYNQLYIKAWTLLSVILAFVLFGMFVLGGHLLHYGDVVWSLLRWLASPVI